MQTITVTHPAGSYPIYLGESILAQTGPLLAGLGFKGRCALVTNPSIGQHYAGPLLDSLTRVGFEPTAIEIPDGEQYKTLDTVAGLYPRFVEARLDRRSPVLALGGGVVGDTVGFAAASFLRGVPFVQIPTSLLSMVDASVGGKTGVDLPQGKNLVGAFKQPEMVVIDPQVLNTLPHAEFISGMAELIKHGILNAPDLFAALEDSPPTSSNLLPVSFLRDAILVKVGVVQEDPFEKGRRAVLNLGHTFGHAFEHRSNFEIRHGEAVAMGIVCAARLAVRLGYCDEITRRRITALLAQVGLPIQHPDYPANEVWDFMFRDKKRKGNAVPLILPRAIGDVDIFTDIPKEEVMKTLND